MEKRSPKKNPLTQWFHANLGILACNVFKLCAPVFQRGDLCGLDGKTSTFHVRISGSGRKLKILVFKTIFVKKRVGKPCKFLGPPFKGVICWV